MNDTARFLPSYSDQVDYTGADVPLDSAFRVAANTAIEALARAARQAIVLGLDSGNATVVGFMRRTPNDWPSPDGSMRGSGWQIVTKGWTIPAADLETISGKRATVDDEPYYIVSAMLQSSGLLILDLGYARD